MFPVDSKQGVEALLFDIRRARLANADLSSVGERQTGGADDVGAQNST